jgi:exonuclease SbcC
MVRLKYAKIKGLFGYLDAYFEFADTLTVVTGANGSGKSSLNFTLNWVFCGDPEGEEIIFQLKDKDHKTILKEMKIGSAEFGLSDGTVITKTRTRGGRTVYTHSGYKDPFIQSAVPECVKESLGIIESSFGDIEKYMNFYFQHDAHFMLSETPTAGAKVLDKIANVEIVTLAFKSFNSDKYTATDVKSAAEKELERITKDLLKYQNLDMYRVQIDNCSLLLQEIDKKVILIDKLKGLLEAKNRLILALSGINDRLAFIGDLEPLKRNIKQLKQTYTTYGTLFKLCETRKEYARKMYKCKSGLEFIGDLQPLKIRLFDLSKDYALSSRLTALSNLIYNKSSRLVTTEKLLLLLSHIGSIKPRLDGVLAMFNLKNNLEMLQSNKKSLSVTLNRVTLNLSRFDNVSNDLVTVTELRERFNKYVLLSGVSLRLKMLQDKKSSIESRLYELRDIWALQTGISAVSQKYQVSVTMRESLAKCHALQHRLKMVCYNWDRQNNLVTNCEAELKAAWDVAGGVCPLCKTVVRGACDHD